MITKVNDAAVLVFVAADDTILGFHVHGLHIPDLIPAHLLTLALVLQLARVKHLALHALFLEGAGIGTGGAFLTQVTVRPSFTNALPALTIAPAMTHRTHGGPTAPGLRATVAETVRPVRQAPALSTLTLAIARAHFPVVTSTGKVIALAELSGYEAMANAVADALSTNALSAVAANGVAFLGRAGFLCSQ